MEPMVADALVGEATGTARLGSVEVRAAATAMAVVAEVVEPVEVADAAKEAMEMAAQGGATWVLD